MLIHGVQVVEGNKIKLSYRKLGEQHATGRWGTVIDPDRYRCLVLEHDTGEIKGYKHTGILPDSLIVH